MDCVKWHEDFIKIRNLTGVPKQDLTHSQFPNVQLHFPQRLKTAALVLLSPRVPYKRLAEKDHGYEMQWKGDFNPKMRNVALGLLSRRVSPEGGSVRWRRTRGALLSREALTGDPRRKKRNALPHQWEHRKKYFLK